MAIKNILVAYNGTESSGAALDAAIQMQQRYDAHLTGILVLSTAPKHQMSTAWIPKTIQKSLLEAQINAAEEIHSKFKAHTENCNNPSKIHWICERDNADATVSKYARLFDITVIGRYDAVLGSDYPELHPDTIAMVSGRPVLLVPRNTDHKIINEHAVLAWDGKRASARAMADAMHNLETKSLVTVVTIVDGDIEPLNKTMNVIMALERHDINTEYVVLKRNGKSIAFRLLEFLDKTNPKVLIMGAYEHSKFHQTIVGGVTSTVLKKAKIPIILSH